MTSIFRGALLGLTLVITAPAFAGNPAARVGDATSCAGTGTGTIVGPGTPNLLIEGKPAVRVGDQVACPGVIGMVPVVGGPIVTGSGTVRIGGQPAARVGDMNAENGPPGVILTGAQTVFIGN